MIFGCVESSHGDTLQVSGGDYNEHLSKVVALERAILSRSQPVTLS